MIATSARRSLKDTFGIGDWHKSLAENAIDELLVLREALQITSMPFWKTPEPIRKQAFWRTLLGGNWKDHCRLRQHHENDFNSYWKIMQQFDLELKSDSIWDDHDLVRVSNVENNAIEIARERRFCMSESGCMGWIPKAGKKGDIISVLCGCSVPVLLRPRGNAYEVIGTCYIHPIMDGETVAAAQNPMQQIDLV